MDFNPNWESFHMFSYKDWQKVSSDSFIKHISWKPMGQGSIALRVDVAISYSCIQNTQPRAQEHIAFLIELYPHHHGVGL